MKNLITLISFLAVTTADGQYFQQRFNLDYATPKLRNERCNSGIRTRDNYAAFNPALFYYAGIGTSYNNTTLPAPDNVADRMRFEQLDNTGATVISNLGYQFADAGTVPFYHSYGNSIAEVKNTSNTGGYVTVGSVTNNTITGAAAILGNSDMLFTQLDAAGNVLNAVRTDISGGSDRAWCIRKSAILSAGQPTWIVCGESQRGATNTDCFVARVLANGTIVWCFRYNFDPTGGAFTTAYNVAKQLCEDAAGNIYVVGTLQDAPAGAQGINGLAFKLTPAGAVVWVNDYQLFSDDQFQAVRLSFDGNIVIGGFTNFGAVAPVTHHMLITKLAAANGAVIFQNILAARKGATTYTSRCYDIIERAGAGVAPEYFLAGPLITAGGTYEMMYKANAAGLGINWYAYNRMNYNIGFGLDDVNVGAWQGVAYFSSMRNPTTAAFSDSHIMKTDYSGRTCNFCGVIPPRNIIPNLIPQQRNRMQVQTGQQRKLVWQQFKYSDKVICNVPVIACPSPALTAVAEDESEAKSIETVKAGTVKIFPNPVANVIKGKAKILM